MPLDPSIALSVRNPRIEYNPVNPINAMLQGEQLRGAQQANALRQLQMQQSQREMQQKEVLNRLLVGATSPEGDLDYGKAITALAGAGMGEQLPELAERRDRTRLKQAQIEAAQAAQQREGLEKALSFLGRANEQNYPAIRQFMVQMAPGVEGLLPAAYDKASIDALAGRMEQQVKESADLANMKALGFPLTPEGYQQYMSSRFQPTRASQAGTTDAASTPAFGRAPSGYRFTSEGSLEPIPGGPAARRAAAPAAPAAAPSVAAESGLSRKEIERRNAAFPKASNALKAFDASSDDLIAKLTELSQSPGLNQITGLLGGRIVGVTDEGRRAQALFDTVAARGQFQELQQMRDASPTGGALGNVSNREGELLRQAFAAIDRRQSKADVQKEIQNVINKIQASKARVREAFEETYDYRTNQPEQATPAVGATPRAAPAEAVPASRARPSGDLTPQEQKELERLRAKHSRAQK